MHRSRVIARRNDETISRYAWDCFVVALLAMTTLLILIKPEFVSAATSDYVRTANYYLLSGSALENKNTIATLAEFDLIIIPSEAQLFNKPFFSDVRKLNPDIIILAYVPTVSWNNVFWSDALHIKLLKGIKNDWWLRDSDGNKTSIWPNTHALDLNSGWTDYLAGFVKSDILATGLWDGIFYDEVMDRSDWKQGYKKLFSKTRTLVGDQEIIITNGSSDSDFASYVNGRMFETFPSTKNATSSWTSNTKNYLALESSVGHDPIMVINVNTENTGTQTNYQKMRFGLTTTLLGDGYFSYDYGTENHAQLWTYDEYDVALGDPKGSAEFLGTLVPSGPSVWERDYEKGKVVVNATNTTQTVKLGGEYEKLHGSQDTVTNNGAIVSKITIGSQDGLVLLRPLETLLHATYLNGAFARIFSSTGATKRNGFFAYDSSGKGGTRVNVSDLDGDGTEETVVADDTYVTIYETNGSVRKRFAPYTDAYKLGVNIAIGDLENDGSIELVTGTENGGGPQIRIFNGDGNLIHPGFFAYDTAFRGGVNVAIGDLNGDNVNEIIAGAGVGGGPHVRVFNKDGKLINPGFFAYDEKFRGGVNVAAGDVDGDGIDDIVTGPGKGGGPQIKVFDRDGGQKVQFFAFEADGNDGVEVSAADLDEDGRAEIIGLSSDVFTLSFK